MRKKATIYVDSDLLRATKIQAAREERAEYHVIEDALRQYLGLDIFDELRERNRDSGLNEDAALELAVREVKAYRREQRRK